MYVRFSMGANSRGRFQERDEGGGVFVLVILVCIDIFIINNLQKHNLEQFSSFPPEIRELKWALAQDTTSTIR